MATATDDIAATAKAVLNGGIAAFPTETVYGLGAMATHAEGVRRIFEVKRRPQSHPLILHVHSFADFEGWVAGIPEPAYALARRFLPGPLTIILKKSQAVPGIVTGGRSTVALRVPSHPVARELLRMVAAPVAAPSANLHGHTSATNAEHVLAEFRDIDMPVLDGGPSGIGIESAIVDLSSPEAPRLMRSGSLSLGEIKAVLGMEIANLSEEIHDEASGGLARHYSPRKSLLLAADSDGMATDISRNCGCGLISRTRPDMHTGPWLKAPDSAADYARKVYSMLRKLDAMPCPFIVVEPPPRGSEWAGVNDRLRRASTPREA